MKCVIPGRGIRAFGKSIYCLAKIGEEIYIEALEDGLALKTVNSARSAYACFLFQRTFFHSYRDGRSTSVGSKGVTRDEEEEDSGLKCKILAKSILTVFRALGTLERTVDHFTLSLDLDENKLIFVFNCKHGVVKTHSLGYQECEALQAVFTKDLCPNHIAAPAKVLSEVVTHFPAGLEEVTLIAHPSGVRLKNYVEDDGEGTRVSLTEISLAPGEFDQYQIGVDAAITFCLKEMRAILMFTDAINHCLSLRFEVPGRPVVFSIENGNEYRADFVLATLLDPTSPSQQSSTVQASINAPVSTQSRASTRNGVSQLCGTNGTTSVDDFPELNDTVGDNRTSTRRRNDFTHRKKKANSNVGDEQSTSNPPRKTNQDIEFPSVSQFTHTDRGTLKTSSISDTRTKVSHSSQTASQSHVPAPPEDLELDFMDVEVNEYERQPVAGDISSHIGGATVRDSEYSSAIHTTATGVSEKATDDNFDVMDAIFGDENRNDVADDFNQFGFGIESRCEQRKDKVKDQNKSSYKGKDSIKSDRLGKKIGHSPWVAEQTGKSVEREEEKEMESQDAMTQDSIINDSGFLPSTPPAKKHKLDPFSVLFGMDMFTHDHSRSEVLAPDSDSDG